MAMKLFSRDHWSRAVTNASSLDSWYGLSHECVQDGTCVKFEASKPTQSGNIVRLGDP